MIKDDEDEGNAKRYDRGDLVGGRGGLDGDGVGAEQHLEARRFFLLLLSLAAFFAAFFAALLAGFAGGDFA